MDLIPEEAERLLLRIDRLLSDEDRLEKSEQEFLCELAAQIEQESRIKSYQMEAIEQIEARFGVR